MGVRAAVTLLGEDDPLALAMNRAVDGRPIPGNAVHHVADSPRALERMLDAIRGAQRRVHLENYIIRGDETGRRFADALGEKARAGVPVRVLYDALGSFGTRERFWRGLRQQGVEVRAFHPLGTTGPVDLLRRNHRKLLAVDGDTAMLGGLCIGNEWAGDPAARRQAWRDTMIVVEGPAAMIMEQSFARMWSRAGGTMPDDALRGPEPQARGGVDVRVVDGVPGRTRMHRVAQLAYDTAAERIWIWDAYLAPPPPLLAALLDAARGGVDVRIMVPSTSDIRLVRDITRFGYRDLLLSGVRVFEWRGPMLHAKVMLIDRRWGRIGSTNLNVSSLYANHELDVVIESPAFADELSEQFQHDMAHSTEIVLRPGRYMRWGRMVDVGADGIEEQRHHRTPYERQVAAVVTLRRLAGGVRRKFTAAAAGIFALIGILLVVFPRPVSLVIAAICFTIAGTIALEAIRAPAIDDRRRVPRTLPSS